MDEELLLMKEQRKQSLKMEPTPGEETIWFFRMTKKYLEYCIDLIDKEEVSFEKISSNFERCSVDKVLSKSDTCYRESVCERKSQWKWQTSLSYFKKLLHPPQRSATTTLISLQPSTSR